MPTITKLFDDFADAVGRANIERAQKERMANGTFYAQEGEFSIGKKPPPPERYQTADEWLRQSALIATDPMINPSLRRDGESILDCMTRLKREKAGEGK